MWQKLGGRADGDGPIQEAQPAPGWGTGTQLLGKEDGAERARKGPLLLCGTRCGCAGPASCGCGPCGWLRCYCSTRTSSSTSSWAARWSGPPLHRVAHVVNFGEWPRAGGVEGGGVTWVGLSQTSQLSSPRHRTWGIVPLSLPAQRVKRCPVGWPSGPKSLPAQVSDG